MLAIFLSMLIFVVGIINLCGIYSKHPMLPDSRFTKENVAKWIQIPGMRFFLWCLLLSAVLAVIGIFQLLA